MARATKLGLAVILPTHNEERYVGEMLRLIGGQVSKRFSSYAIVVTDGASVDGTRRIVETEAKRDSHIRLIEHHVRKRRGYDARDAMGKVDASLYFYVDADLPSSVKYFGRLLAAQRKGCDVVLGSRYIGSSSLHRPPLRLFVSRSYNRLLNVFFNERITDHQCGFRLFNERAAKLIRSESREEHWMWDTEVILLALREGLSVCEVPIGWREIKSSRTPLRRLADDIWLHGTGILRLFARFRLGRDS